MFGHADSRLKLAYLAVFCCDFAVVGLGAAVTSVPTASTVILRDTNEMWNLSWKRTDKTASKRFRNDSLAFSQRNNTLNYVIKLFIVYMILVPISSSVQSKMSPPLNTPRCNRT